jgi:hypothetical protein
MQLTAFDEMNTRINQPMEHYIRLSNSCDKKQGVCTNTTGCKPGWQYVQSEQQKCDMGMLRKCYIIHKKGATNV